MFRRQAIEPDYEARRVRMVQRQLIRRGIRDRGVLASMSTVPRERFLPPDMRGSAYRDAALPLSRGQTISQPYIVAAMVEGLTLEPGDRVLEVGTGSGYAAAVLSRIADRVDTVERLAELAELASETLAELGYDNVFVHVGDGSTGWSEAAPFDAICVSAAAPAPPSALLAQLSPGGRLVVPVGARSGRQALVRVRRDGDTLREETLADVRFVPLVGSEGWEPA